VTALHSELRVAKSLPITLQDDVGCLRSACWEAAEISSESELNLESKADAEMLLMDLALAL
jgi:hypothetical protein